VAACVLVACGSDRHHPENFVSGAVHGPALKQQAEDCRSCHGDDLTGGSSAISCDGCHTGATPTTWRQNCTFCHGGVDNETGAPPRNLEGTDRIGPFPAHGVHVTGSPIANAYDCTQCHTKANDVLSPGHIFDDTPGAAENDYGNGLSPQTTFARDTATCSNAYCHGSGRADDGMVVASAGPMPCSGCHPTQESGAAGWGNMSGPHALHIALANVTCANCHQGTTTDGASIASKELHINGLRDVTITEPSFTYDSARATCSGDCHGYAHANRPWTGIGGKYHPAGYASRTVHGPEMELQRKDCRGCHGDTLAGGASGLSGPSCDTCHGGGTPAWRTNCTFCHGGGLDQTGAPPRDLGSSVLNVSQSFVAHRKHVAPTMMSPNDCTTCHAKPTDVLTAGHAFDATAQAAEVMLTLDGRNPGATYNNGTCSNLYCHGNGRANGTVTDGTAATCTSCHGGQANNRAGMSGDHRDHHGEFICAECHLDTMTTGFTVIATPARHVNKVKDVRFLAPNFTYANNLCNGVCHGESHANESW